MYSPVYNIISTPSCLNSNHFIYIIGPSWGLVTSVLSGHQVSYGPVCPSIIRCHGDPDPKPMTTSLAVPWGLPLHCWLEYFESVICLNLNSQILLEIQAIMLTGLTSESSNRLETARKFYCIFRVILSPTF